MLIKRIHFDCRQIRHDFHVTVFDGLPAANTGTVKHAAFFQHFFGHFCNRDSKMLPCSNKIDELHVHHNRIILFCKFNYLFRRSHNFFLFYYFQLLINHINVAQKNIT